MTIQFITQIGPGFHTQPNFEPMHYPAGEATLKIIEGTPNTGPRTQIALLNGANSDDLIMLAMWADACHQRNEHTIALIPYLPGARADRGTPFGAKVYANIINNMNINQIIAADPHSEIIKHLTNNLTILTAAELLQKTLTLNPTLTKYAGIIAPDHGAINRATQAAQLLNLPLYKAEKHRNFETGKLSEFTCEPLPQTGTFLIVDDICDGGGTFMGLATATGLPKNRLDLWVTHGIFSGHAEQLFQHYGNILTTDSHPGNTRLKELGAIVLPLRETLTHAAQTAPKITQNVN